MEIKEGLHGNCFPLSLTATEESFELFARWKTKLYFDSPKCLEVSDDLSSDSHDSSTRVKLASPTLFIMHTEVNI